MNRTLCSLNRASCNLAQSLYWNLYFFKGLRTFVSGVYNKNDMLDTNQSGKTDCAPYTRLAKIYHLSFLGIDLNIGRQNRFSRNTRNLKYLDLVGRRFHKVKILKI